MSSSRRNNASFRPSRIFRSQSVRQTVTATVIGSLLALTTPALAGGCAADFDGDGAVGGSDLAILLGSWGGRGVADLDGNGIVNGGDLGGLLGSWGPCAATCSGFTDMAFTAETFTLPGLSDAVTLDGVIHVAPFGGPDGVVMVGLPSGFTALIEMHPGMTTVMMPDVTLDLVPFAPPGVVLVDGIPTSSSDLLSFLEADISSGATIGSWSPTSRATLALVALGSTQEWACNVAAAKALPLSAAVGQGFWCKTAAYTAAAAVTVLATAGCAALTAGCGAATTVTIGGMAVPCVWVIALCAGGVFVGAAVTYEGILAFWGDQQD